MKKYKVNVNGQVYEITVEECEVGEQVAAPAVSAAPAVAPAAGEQSVNSPMPGTILAVNVTAGAKVKKGDVLFILEAMKMETEICAQSDGTVAGVNVTKGAAVESGTLLCTLS